MTKKQVHFSIDDVLRSFKYIATQRPNSIFDLNLYGTLKQWHEEFGVNVSLYCIGEMEGFNIIQLPDVYKNEFSDNKDWLKFGFHSSSDQPFYEDKNYSDGYMNVLCKLKKMDAGLTNVIRLHSWKATKQQKEWLLKQGITTILYPDTCLYYYDENGVFIEDGMIHRVTKCWIERITEIDRRTAHIGDDYISCFTHEWCFAEEKDKIEKLLKLYYREGYFFV